MVRVALTGTPGVGKTTLARRAEAMGWRVVDVTKWARDEGCVVERDEEAGADVVDTEALAARVPADDGSRVLYEGHLSHLLGLDAAWVVRLDPLVLRGRLEKRGYGPEKIHENVEAEAIDIILQETLDAYTTVVQRDGTRRDPDGLLKSFADIPIDRFKGRDLEPVDWSHRLPIP